MSELMKRVIRTVEAIPAGRAMTYGDVARLTGTGARAVGRMLHNSRDIPWWRVVGADGRPYPGATHEARARFLEESTPLIDSDDIRVDLERASWSPDDW